METVPQALRRYLRELTRERIQSADLEFINRAADVLNQEAAEVLDYQTWQE